MKRNLIGCAHIINQTGPNVIEERCVMGQKHSNNSKQHFFPVSSAEQIKYAEVLPEQNFNGHLFGQLISGLAYKNIYRGKIGIFPLFFVPRIFFLPSEVPIASMNIGQLQFP